MRLPFVRGLAVFAVSLAAASLATAAAHAGTDLVPPVAQLFAWNARPELRAAGPVSCAANAAGALPLADARRRAALARIAAVMAAEPGDAEPLDGRGYAYPVARDPNAEMRRIVMEAQRARLRD